MDTPLAVNDPEELWGLVLRTKAPFFDFLATTSEMIVVQDAEMEANPAVLPDASAALVTSPVELTGATPVLLLDHVADEVTSCVDPSEYWAKAVNCCVPPASAMTGFCGLTIKPTGTAEPTVKLAGVVAAIVPIDAEIVAEPEAKVEARPLNAATLLIVATIGLPD